MVVVIKMYLEETGWKVVDESGRKVQVTDSSGHCKANSVSIKYV
jgi:hypothetical protein